MKFPIFPLLFASLLATCSLLSAEEKPAPPAPPKALFDGQSLAGFTNQEGKAPGAGWVVEDGAIHRKGKSGDLYVAGEHGDFTLEFEWKIAAAGNSGVKYRVQLYGKSLMGPEYQLLDDEKHPDGKVGAQRQTASLYDILPPEAAKKQAKPAGEWNTTKIVAQGTKFEHWLNGALVLEVDTTSETFKKAVAASKFKAVPDFAQNPVGKIFFQDHGDEVWLRNLKLKAAPAGK